MLTTAFHHLPTGKSCNSLVVTCLFATYPQKTALVITTILYNYINFDF